MGRFWSPSVKNSTGFYPKTIKRKQTTFYGKKKRKCCEIDKTSTTQRGSDFYERGSWGLLCGLLEDILRFWGRSWGTPGALVEAKTTKKLPKRYVYSEIWVFGERRTPKRSDEPDDIPFVSFDGKRKKTKKPTRLISTSHSVSFAGTKSRVRTLDAPELRLSMFQRWRNPNGTHIRPPEKTIERAIEGISSYIYV